MFKGLRTCDAVAIETEPGIFTDREGICSPCMEGETWNTTSHKCVATSLIPGISNTILMMITGGIILIIVLAGRR